MVLDAQVGGCGNLRSVPSHHSSVPSAGCTPLHSRDPTVQRREWWCWPRGACSLKPRWSGTAGSSGRAFSRTDAISQCSCAHSLIRHSLNHSFIQHGLAGTPLGGAGGVRCHETDTVPAPGQDPASLWGPDNKKWHILQSQAVIVCEGEKRRKGTKGDFLF